MAGVLDGKIAIVTGSGKNIGRGVAHQLARDGATVVVNGRGDREAIEAVAREIAEAGGKAIHHLADVADEAAVGAMIDRVAGELGGIDIVVSNAGLRRQTPFVELTFAEWKEIMSVALDGAFLLTRAAVPHMIARGGGTIVAMSGISHRIGTPNRPHVSASKAGLEGLIRSLAIELAPHGIRANCVAPGAIDTVRGAAAGQLPSTMTNSTVPLGRKGTIDEITATVRFLVGPESGYITGQTIHANGGAWMV